MSLIDDLYTWTDRVLLYGVLALFFWAVVDCAIRKQSAFPAAQKLTKPAWLAILVIGGGLGSLVAYVYDTPINVISLIALIAALVYLADVRPAVREA